MNRALIVVIVAIAIAARAVVGLGLEGRVHFPDSRQYIKIAHNIRAGDGPGLNESAVAARPPGYPYFLAAIFSVFGSSSDAPPLLAVRLAQALLGGLLCLVIYLTGKKLYSHAVGLVAAALVALDPFLTYFSGLVLSEALFALVLAAAMLSLLHAQDGNVRWAAAAGALLGAAAMVRASTLLMIPPVAAAWMLLRWKKPRSIQQGAAVLLLAAAVMSPWAWRNYKLTGSPVFTTLSAGASLYEATYPGADGGPAIDKIKWPEETESMGEAEKDAYLRRRALEFIRQDPLRILSLAFVKLRRFWSIFPNFSEYRRPVVMAVSALYMVPMLVCIAAGIIIRRKTLGAAAILLVPAIYFTGLHMVFVGSIRYRAPVMPLLAVFAGAAVVAFARRAFGTAGIDGAQPTE
jgi:4-amino-4-deoxy-L-arabinose transferase-like glycosyltransferase